MIPLLVLAGSILTDGLRGVPSKLAGSSQWAVVVDGVKTNVVQSAAPRK